MSATQAKAAPERTAQRRLGPTLAAFIIGLPLSAAIIWPAYYGSLQGTLLARYVSHPVEVAEVILFCCALGALGVKLLGWLMDRAALGRDWLPAWDGHPVPVSETTKLLVEVKRRPAWQQRTLVGQRVTAILDFLRLRGSTGELDDHLRALGDSDFSNQEGSYSLIRFITWAIPILGFLGTVLGITDAIAGVTPEQLEHSISAVTDGLALAFDTTAVALALTMVAMFCTFLVERLEEGVLQGVDRFVEQHLAHRFERTGAAGGEFVEVVRQQSQALLQGTETLVRKQAEIWSKTFEEAAKRQSALESSFQAQLSAALATALDRSLAEHAKRLASMEQQAAQHTVELTRKLEGLGKLADGLKAQAEVLSRLQEGEKQLIQMQERLDQNLAALADAGAFQEAVHSLTAAIHLLTSHTARSTMPVRKPGAAA
ncbi:MAG: MotA/TolQ/ExbB proton channel family protein [Planctomycetia bacterium]|nr:MotA/TolQ/ExbB proton channel family protein [Planctomycetia bacterium]